MKIVHIIVGLNDGGAEANLFKICKYDRMNEHIVICLMNKGKYGPLLIDLGIQVHFLKMKSDSLSVFFFLNLLKLLYFIRPDIVQTWMYHADLLGGIASRLVGIKNIVWNIRNSDLKKYKSKRRTIWIANILAKLSWWLPRAIVVCAKRAIVFHESIGYCKKKMHFIPNGYDFSIFASVKKQKYSIRKKLKIKKQIPLIGTVARFNPQKDHSNLLYALYKLRNQNIDFYCILVGENINENNKFLINLIKKLELKNYVKLMGNSNNIPKVMRELDLHILPSEYGEGFPNVVAEAMACNTPCVVTNVGDAALIVGKTGWVVPPKNHNILASAIRLALYELKFNKNWKIRQNQARLRIEKNFGIHKMISSYQKLWKELY